MSDWRNHTRLVLFGMSLVAVNAACGCSPEKAHPAAASSAQEQTATKPPEPPVSEPLAFHMRDHLSIAVHARDAVVRGRLEDAVGPLTWLAQHREPNATEAAKPFIRRMQAAAQRGLDSGDLSSVGRAIGEIGASCGACHRARAAGPKLEPTGQEELDAELTLETHMHAYLWATETLWHALLADPALWPVGVSALEQLEPPARSRPLASHFAAVRDWAVSARAAETSQARGEAYGQLITLCGECHQRRAVVP